MKEITEQNRAVIAAKYLGQKLIFKHHKQWQKNFFVTPSTIGLLLDGNSNFKNSSILLRPLSSITDQDAIEVARICGVIDNGSKAGKDLLEKYITSNQCNVEGLDWFKILDYLRATGYALPCTVIHESKRVTYSVQELVELGVIKIVE